MHSFLSLTGRSLRGKRPTVQRTGITLSYDRQSQSKRTNWDILQYFTVSALILPVLHFYSKQNYPAIFLGCAYVDCANRKQRYKTNYSTEHRSKSLLFVIAPGYWWWGRYEMKWKWQRSEMASHRPSSMNNNLNQILNSSKRGWHWRWQCNQSKFWPDQLCNSSNKRVQMKKKKKSISPRLGNQSSFHSFFPCSRSFLNVSFHSMFLFSRSIKVIFLVRLPYVTLLCRNIWWSHIKEQSIYGSTTMENLPASFLCLWQI